ncbi:Subtilase [Fusarium albosuccineum]|uniref:Subtilase n=1 Tax=Fusarium albosuccineum TaxID=1237068 RepID=A0A8H4PFN7_9HYPO|nr:Subtilase [Fusarium albosuccineum]
MRMQTILSLVLVTTGVSHLMPRDFNSNRTPALMERAASGKKIISIKVATIKVPGTDQTDSGRCNAAQIEILNTTIPEARRMLENAAKALAKKGVEKSPAYTDWFGKQKAVTAKLLKKHNFQAPLDTLRLSLEVSTDTLAPGDLDPNAVTFTCWPEKDIRCNRSGQYRWVAGTKNPSGKDPAGTLVGLCPMFFELSTLEEVVREFDPNRADTRVSSAALTIVHEMQHVMLATGEDRVCKDIVYHTAE